MKTVTLVQMHSPTIHLGVPNKSLKEGWGAKCNRGGRDTTYN
jgi:hypothetical protein